MYNVNMQKGSAQILIFFAALILVVGGIYFYPKIKSNQVQIPNYNPSKRIDTKDYSNPTLGFSFKYPTGLIVKEDSEEDFNKRGNGDFRKNFKEYVAYEPGKFLGGVAILDKDKNFDTNPFALWVYDNPKDLTIDEWYKLYWYYPFMWGDFTYKGKFELAPKEEATVSGKLGKSGLVDYQPGKPKFVYISKDKKMYLFRIIGETGDKILSSFKFQSR